MNIEEKEKMEIDYWKNSHYENPDNFTPNNLIYKLSEAKVFLDKVDKVYPEIFEKAENILELGAGQGWASVIVKSKFTSHKIIISDISQCAIDSLWHWERLFAVKIDQSLVCRSYQLPLPGNSFDLVFTFQSFHHFGKYKDTLLEVYRVLKPGGICLLLYEPSSSNLLYKLAFKRVNAKRTIVPEDVLRYKEINTLSKEIGFSDVRINFVPDSKNRQMLSAIYYSFLKKIKFLQKILPCTIDVYLKK